ncbi:XkdQ/YqbQ family protein [Cohnella nanjingensis]|uniref:YqbQ/XkdQ domain-containing protein n=1 Tax=Cohnella nanjingensis TaxID=1387779 RepID=A0A7X0VDT6_9BACL|nr:hypothetical protein [Cohnella nanjingensis]MBB6670285.1 hypothetical protein [Cohnella nanjingensis]
MLELLLDNRNGNVWDLSNIVSDVTWKTSRIGKPGSLEFTLVRNGIYQDPGFRYNNGDVVRFRKDGVNVFYGYVFRIGEGMSEDVKILCYDQIRYLLASETYVFSNVTASDVVKQIASDFKLKVGKIDDTGYRIPSLIQDNQKLLDTICKALDWTLIKADRNYFLYDDFGELSLRNSYDMLLSFFIGDESLMYDFAAERSIDSDTYNKVKLYQDNKKAGKRDTYIAQDSANIAKWGLLQLTQSVDEKMNAAQIRELLNALIATKNKETKTLKIDAIGDIRVRAGCYLPVLIGDFGINQSFLVDECSHHFDGGHTMSLELKVI